VQIYTLGRLIAGGFLQPINRDYIPNLDANVWDDLHSPFYDVESRYSIPYAIWNTGVMWRNDFVTTDVAGLANPARVDEPTGRALFLPRPLPNDPLGPQPVFGNDRIVGASITAGRGLPVVLSTNAAVLSRCAPYHYNADGTINDSFLSSPIGTCEEPDRTTFLDKLSNNKVGPVFASRETINASQTLEVPNLYEHVNQNFVHQLQAA